MTEMFFRLKRFLSSKYEGSCSGFSLSDFVHAFGKASDALLYSSLFMPELIKIEDSILLRDNSDLPVMRKRFLEAKQKIENNNVCISKLEASFNFIEIGYAFEPSGRNTSDEEDEILVYRIRDAWDAWLKLKYPDRKFIVESLSSEQTGSTVGVTFFQKR